MDLLLETGSAGDIREILRRPPSDISAHGRLVRAACMKRGGSTVYLRTATGMDWIAVNAQRSGPSRQPSVSLTDKPHYVNLSAPCSSDESRTFPACLLDDIVIENWTPLLGLDDIRLRRATHEVESLPVR